MKIFFQAPNADITTNEALREAINSEENTCKIISSNVADFIKSILDFGAAPQLSDCVFGFEDSKYYQVDKKGAVTFLDDTAELSAQRETTLANVTLKKYGVDELSFIDGVLKLKSLNVDELHQAIVDIFDINPGITAVIERVAKTEKQKGKVQKVAMMSLEDFKEVVDVIESAIAEREVPSLAYLKSHVAVEKYQSSEYKFAYRTFYRGLLKLPLPSKASQDVNFQAMQHRLDASMKDGVEAAYKKIADAVKANPDQAIKDFHI